MKHFGKFAESLRGESMQRRMILSTLVLVGCLINAAPSLADGAVAVGIAPGGVIRGYAIGTSHNGSSEEGVRQTAIEACKKSRGTNVEATSRCAVVGTFRNQCFSSALDRKDGTPGAGWGIGDTQADADAEAMKKCRATAGPARRSFCVVTDRLCDGTADPANPGSH
jgi:Domain of unknown function (DUF4189)